MANRRGDDSDLNLTTVVYDEREAGKLFYYWLEVSSGCDVRHLAR